MAWFSKILGATLIPAREVELWVKEGDGEWFKIICDETFNPKINDMKQFGKDNGPGGPTVNTSGTGEGKPKIFRMSQFSKSQKKDRAKIKKALIKKMIAEGDKRSYNQIAADLELDIWRNR